MPVLAKFCGVVIRLLCLRSLGARLHACYGDSEMVIDLANGNVLQDEMPERIRRMVLAWAKQHRAEIDSTLHRCRRAAGVPALAW